MATKKTAQKTAKPVGQVLDKGRKKAAPGAKPDIMSASKVKQKKLEATSAGHVDGSIGAEGHVDGSIGTAGHVDGHG